MQARRLSDLLKGHIAWWLVEHLVSDRPRGIVLLHSVWIKIDRATGVPRRYRWFSTVLNSITPFFIVDDLRATLAFYQSSLGFSVPYKGGGNGESDDFWAFVARDSVMLMFKHIASDVRPQPNRSRHEWARWDAYIYTDDPDSLYAEFVAKGVQMHSELANTQDGLRAFEITDNNGYVLCFGRPVKE